MAASNCPQSGGWHLWEQFLSPSPGTILVPVPCQGLEATGSPPRERKNSHNKIMESGDIGDPESEELSPPGDTEGTPGRGKGLGPGWGHRERGGDTVPSGREVTLMTRRLGLGTGRGQTSCPICGTGGSRKVISYLCRIFRNPTWKIGIWDGRRGVTPWLRCHCHPPPHGDKGHWRVPRKVGTTPGERELYPKYSPVKSWGGDLCPKKFRK